MRHLSQHLIDLVENAVAAGASRVEIEIDRRHADDLLIMRVRDNGCGMSPEAVKKITDPFFTSRTCRRVGLGVPLLAASANRSGGGLRVQSQLGQGTTVEASFRPSNIDIPPMGDLAGSVLCAIVGHQDVDLCFRYLVDGRSFEIDSGEIKKELDGLSLTHPSVLRWLEQLVSELVDAAEAAAGKEVTDAQAC